MSSIRDFVPLQKIGQGSYSTVYKVKRSSNQKIYALKKVKLGKLSVKQRQNALNQIRILASITSPSIIGYKQAFFDDTINVLCIVMQFADCGDLHAIIEKNKKQKIIFTQAQIWKTAGSLLQALVALHSRGIMHRDLKSANVFKTNKGYKLGDLNVSKVVGKNLAHTQTGTPYYASPQVWRDQSYDYRCDIWSLGCIIFQMATYNLPFMGRDMEALFKNVQNNPVPPIPSTYSHFLSKFITLCLLKNPKHRPMAHELLQNSSFKQYFNVKQMRIQQKDPKLLKTIKLPVNLSQLKSQLPDSKYEIQKIIFNNQQQKQKQFTNQSYSSPILQQKINKSELLNKKQQNSKKQIPILSDYKSDRIEYTNISTPKNRYTNEQNKKTYSQHRPNYNKLYKIQNSQMINQQTQIKRYPTSQSKLNKKLSQISRNSDRIYLSSKKSNKVQMPSKRYYHQDFTNNPSLLLQIMKKPNYSYVNMDKSNLINKIQNNSYIRQMKGIPRMQRPKVQLKKVRVGSNGVVKPKNFWL